MKSLVLPIKIIILTAIISLLLYTAQIKLTLLAGFYHQTGWFVSVILIFLLTSLVGAARWFILNRAQEIYLGFFRTTVFSYVGAAFNNLLPGAVGGDFFRFLCVTKKIPGKKSATLVTLFLDRLTGFFGILITISFIAMTRIHSLGQQRVLFHLLFVVAIFCASALLTMIFLMTAPKKLGLLNWLNRRFPNKPWAARIISFFESDLLGKFTKTVIFESLLTSVVIQILIASSILIIAHLMGLPPIAFSDYALAIGITQIVNLIPLTPGGIGVGELAFANVILMLNPGINGAFATVLIGYRLISVLVYLPGVILYAPTMLVKKPIDNNSSAINYSGITSSK